MSPICASGHDSQTTDYCDECGLKLGVPAGPPPDAPPDEGPSPEATAIAPTTKTCPHCGQDTDAEGDFCENCGGDLRPGAAPVEAALPAAPSSPVPTPGAGWEIVVNADRNYFARFDLDEAEFPSDCPERRIALDADEIHIGRRSVSRGIEPEIDLAGPPEDGAVSHDHAVLHLQEGGGWCVVDSGSSNGTFVNDDLEPLAPGQPLELHDGDRVHIGAWTTIVLRRAQVPWPTLSIS